MADSRKASLLAYWVGLGLVGTSVGYFVGFSQSPVIATLLPLLFGVLGTGGIVVVGRTDLEETSSRDRLRRIGVALSVFSLMIILSSAAALAVRNGWIGPSEDQLQLSGGSAETSIELLALRKKLEVLGATGEEQRLVLASAMTSRAVAPADTKTVQKYLAEVVTTSSRVLGLIDSLSASGKIDKTDDAWHEVQNLRPLLVAAGQLFAQWNNAIKKGERTPYFGIAQQAKLLENQLDPIVGNQHNLPITSMETLSKVPALYDALISFRTAAVEARPTLVGVELSGMPSGHMEADELLQRLLTTYRGKVEGPDGHFFAGTQGPPILRGEPG